MCVCVCGCADTSEDQYKYEVEQARKATLQGIHAPMKRWYLRGDLEPEFGKFPMFWQDLESWEHYRTVYRRYMKHMDTADKAKSDGAAAASDTARERPRKKKSRWGEQATPEATQGAPKRRRSRWGAAPAAPRTLDAGMLWVCMRCVAQALCSPFCARVVLASAQRSHCLLDKTMSKFRRP